MSYTNKIIKNIIGDKTSKNNEDYIDWIVVFEGGYKVLVSVPPNTGQNKIMMLARQKQSDKNRYNFEARRASGGRILKVYKA